MPLEYPIVTATDGTAVNSPKSGNQTNKHPLLRMRLAWKDMDYKFAVNPEDYTQSEPNKATITQTKGGAWIDAWGEGVKEITIKGTTGFAAGRRNDDPEMDAGYNRWKGLRNMIQNVYDAVKDGEDVEPMWFYNYTDNEYFYVYPSQGGIELYRNKARPYIYQYTLHLWAVRRIGQAEKERQVLGNPVKSSRKHSSGPDAGYDTSSLEQTNYYEVFSKVKALIGQAKQTDAKARNLTSLVQYAKELKLH